MPLPGAVLGAPEVLADVLAYQTTAEACAPALLESLWVQAYEKKGMLLAHARDALAARLPRIQGILTDHCIPFVPPDGGSCILIPGPDGFPGADTSFVAHLRRHYGVAATPASLFGDSLQGYLRIACG